MMVRICPRCGLANPESAQRCVCGFDFELDNTEKPHLNQGDNTSRSESGLKSPTEGKRTIRRGVIVFVVGLLASILLSVFYGGVFIFIVMSGPVIYGIIQFFKGLGQSSGHRRQ